MVDCADAIAKHIVESRPRPTLHWQCPPGWQRVPQKYELSARAEISKWFHFPFAILHFSFAVAEVANDRDDK
jgi:hypothetical protein